MPNIPVYVFQAVFNGVPRSRSGRFLSGHALGRFLPFFPHGLPGFCAVLLVGGPLFQLFQQSVPDGSLEFREHGAGLVQDVHAHLFLALLLVLFLHPLPFHQDIIYLHLAGNLLLNRGRLRQHQANLAVGLLGEHFLQFPGHLSALHAFRAHLFHDLPGGLVHRQVLLPLFPGRRACAIRLLSMYRPRRFRLRCRWLPNGFFHCARLLYRQLSGRFLRTRLPYR